MVCTNIKHTFISECDEGFEKFFGRLWCHVWYTFINLVIKIYSFKIKFLRENFIYTI